MHKHLRRHAVPIASFYYAILLISVCVIGLAASMLLAPDTRWVGWHLSRLGEGSQLSAAIFNATLCIEAIIFTLMAMQLRRELWARGLRGKAYLVQAVMTLTALCWIGIACFPFDRFVFVHRLFGYGQTVLLGMLCLGIASLGHYFSRRTYYVGIGGVAVFGSLLTWSALNGEAALVFVELSGIAILFLWLLSITRDHYNHY